MTEDRVERGFTVVEVLVAMVLVVAMSFVTIGIVHAFTHALSLRSDAQSGTITLEQELDRMRADAASAYAVFVPTNDIFGKPNAAQHGATGHELDFYTKTDVGDEAYWVYEWDPGARTLQRYDYDVSATTGLPQDIGVADRATGAIDANGHYPALTGVSSFSAQSVFASELAAQPNIFGKVLSGLISAAGVSPSAEPVGFVPANGIPNPDLYGGNTTVQAVIVTQHGSRTLHLTTAAMPAGFTLHDAPSIRAFTYRINSIHRSWFGIVQKTFAHIFNQIQYNYHPSDPKSPWQVWCDYEVYGANIKGIALNDRNHLEDYHPTDWKESTAGTFYTVTHGGYANLAPAAICSEQIPGPNASPIPVPSETSPDVIDTPPPCFDSANPCWPENAPPNWTPPSPWPAASPPPSWCSTHEQSQLCGGAEASPQLDFASAPPDNAAPDESELTGRR